jgi:aspartate/methionine/tyrosine aminotransferase
MKLETFELERIQSEWEHIVKYNLSESGVEPLPLSEMLTETQIEEMLGIRLGYTQTNGTIPLREAIAHPFSIGPEQVLATNGGAEANFLVTWWLLREVRRSGEVLAMTPNYLQIQGVWNALGGRTIPFHLTMQDDRWSINPEELESKVSGSTIAIAVCNPNNPTGSVLNEEEMRFIADLAEEHDLWIISDEVYQGAEHSGLKTPSMFGRYEKVFVTASLSKAFGLPGLRLGWIVAPSEDVAGQLWAYSDYTTICPSILSDWLATIALQPEVRQRLERRAHGIVNRNWGILKSWMDSYENVFECVAPLAAAICFPRVKLDMSALDFVHRLLREKSVLITPGEFFGVPGHLRLGYGCEREYLESALGVISELLDTL